VPGSHALRGVGVALVAAGTLQAELILTRALSAGLFHHLAFLVVSTALLGTGIAGVAVSGLAPRPQAPDLRPARAALAFALTLVPCFALAQGLAVEPLLLAAEPGQLLRMGGTYVLLGVPFLFAGVAVAALLDAHAARAPGLYGADLAGAAAGSLLALAAVPLLGGQDALLLPAALAAAGAVALAAAGPHPGLVRGATAAALLLSTAAGARALIPGPAWLPLHVSRTKTTQAGEPFARVLRDPRRTLSTAWTTGGRVDHIRFAPGVERLVIDGGVAAVRVPPPGARPGASDASLPYELRPGGRFLVVGAGAGWEVAEALTFGAHAVEAVELNPAIAAATPAALAQDPRVTLVVDEGRSYAERATGPFQGVVMVHTISNAASASGAMHLAEDYLLTREALARLLGLLGQDGLLFITRPEAQMPRLVSTLRAALGEERPAAPRLAVWSERGPGDTFYGAVLASPSPLSEGDLRALRARLAQRGGLEADALPGTPAGGVLGCLLAPDLDLTRCEAQAGLRLDPPTDDRPFFHQRQRLSQVRWSTALAALGGAGARMALESEPLAELSSWLVLAETTLIGGLALGVALLLARRRREAGSPSQPSLRLRVTGYFAALGLGFMLLEVALVQRLSLLLGRPALAFAVVFAGLLLGAGLGSARAPRLAARPAQGALLALAAALTLALLLGPLTHAALGWPDGARVALAGALVLAVGFALGAPFPLGLVALSAPARAGLVPWAFAVNAFTSVAATVLSLLLAAELGFTAVLALAGLCYGAAAALFPRAAPP
jgi:hypothetical protein